MDRPKLHPPRHRRGCLALELRPEGIELVLKRHRPLLSVIDGAGQERPPRDPSIAGGCDLHLSGNRMAYRLQALALFRRVARAGSCSRAARQAGLSQPSVSRIVAELERDLGTGLLLRMTQKVVLTEAGTEYLARVEPALAASEEADAAIRGGGLRSLLRFGASSSFGQRELLPLLAGFLAAHPALRLQVELSDARQDLASGGIDVAFRLGRLADSGILARRLGAAPPLGDRLGIHPVAPRQFPQARLPMLDRATDRLCRGGAPVENPAHSAFFHA